MTGLIFGCGYLGRRVASRWLAAGHDVSAVTRSAEKAAELRSAGIRPIIGDVASPETLAELSAVDVVLYAVGYDRSAGVDRRSVVLEGLRNTLAALDGKCDRLIFISTTSVYGQSQGEWIDETSPTEPATEAGRLALAAEELVAEWTAGSDRRSAILRLSGLYGPGRMLRRIDQLQSGEPIEGAGDAWLNLIHVEDAASAVLLATERALDRDANLSRDHQGAKQTPDLFLVSDDCPVRRRDYYGRLADLTGSPPPAFNPSQSSRTPGAGTRCRNDWAKRELGLRLAFPTYEEGLAEALRHPSTTN